MGLNPGAQGQLKLSKKSSSVSSAARTCAEYVPICASDSLCCRAVNTQRCVSGARELASLHPSSSAACKQQWFWLRAEGCLNPY